MSRLHCDYRVGTPGACPRRDENEFYLVNGVQRPLCRDHAQKLAERNEVIHVETEGASRERFVTSRRPPLARQSL
jgi:hypothetical protein